MTFGSDHATAAIAPERTFEIEGKAVLILCGLIASGKSTFAQALEQHYPQFRRCNQDDLGDRRRVEQLTRATLSEGRSVCVDRTNFNASQRSYWIQIAREFPGTKIWVIVFDTPYETCAARLRTRQNHPTIRNAEEGLLILSRFAADFQRPSPSEGYHRILYVKPEETQAIYARSDIAAIMQRVLDSQAIEPSQQPYFSPRYRGGATGGYRGQRGGYNQSYQNHDSRGRGSNSNAGWPYRLRGRQSVSNRGNGLSLGGRGAGQGYPPTTSETQSTSSDIGVGGGGTGSSEDPLGVD